MVDKDNFNSPQGRLLAAQRAQAASGSKIIQPQVKKRVITVPDAEMELEQQDQEYQDQEYQDFLQFQKTQQRVFETEATSSNWEDLPEEQVRKNVSSARKQAQQNRKYQINPAVKDNLELLLGLKRKVETFKIENISFTLKSLTRSEYRTALKNTYLSFQKKEQVDISPADFGLEFQCQQLAMSLMSINNQEPFVFFGTEDYLEIANLLGELSDQVVDELYNFLKTLKPKEPPSTEELVEDLKK